MVHPTFKLNEDNTGFIEKRSVNEERQKVPALEISTQTEDDDVFEKPKEEKRISVELKEIIEEAEKVYIEDDETSEEDMLRPSHLTVTAKRADFVPPTKGQQQDLEKEYPKKYATISSSDRSSPETYSHRKSVSFDLSGDERSKSDLERSYSPDYILKGRQYDSEQEYHSRGRAGLKGILRSASPMAPEPTLDQHLKQSVIPAIAKIKEADVVAQKPIIETNRTTPERERSSSPGSATDSSREKLYDDEIERDNPFREAFLPGNKVDIYEEMARMYSKPKTASKPTRDNFVVGKMKQNSGQSKSVENIPAASTAGMSPSKSTGRLSQEVISKPPPSPKPKIKQANVVRNFTLDRLERDMDHGNFVWFEHDSETNTVTEMTKVPDRNSFSPDAPLPPIPHKQLMRPKESPPPPPINMKTLPSKEKLHHIEVPSVIEIVSTSPEVPLSARRNDFLHENNPDTVLVPEDVHRKILLQENEIRNALKDPFDSEPEWRQPLDVQRSVNPFLDYSETSFESEIVSSMPTFDNQPQGAALSPAKIFPPTQILPVQYTSLPMLQQPGGLYHIPHSQNCIHWASPCPMCFMVSEPNPVAQSHFLHDPHQRLGLPGLDTNPFSSSAQNISVPFSTPTSGSIHNARNFENVNQNLQSMTTSRTAATSSSSFIHVEEFDLGNNSTSTFSSPTYPPAELSPIKIKSPKNYQFPREMSFTPSMSTFGKESSI